MGWVADELRARIEAGLSPTRLDVIDESAQHRGHMGENPEGESHFRVVVWAPGFATMSRVERTRAVLGAAGDLVSKGRVHALSVEARVD